MTLTVNGKEKTLEKEMNLQEFLLSEQYQPNQVAVERNEAIVAKEAYETTKLEQGDILEILTFMGGGCR